MAANRKGIGLTTLKRACNSTTNTRTKYILGGLHGSKPGLMCGLHAPSWARLYCHVVRRNHSVSTAAATSMFIAICCIASTSMFTAICCIPFHPPPHHLFTYSLYKSSISIKRGRHLAVVLGRSGKWGQRPAMALLGMTVLGLAFQFLPSLVNLMHAA